MPGNEPTDGIPLFWSEEGRTAVVVKCHQGHLAARETFEVVGGCPYCNHTLGERIAALQATGRANRTRPSKETSTADERYAAVVEEGTAIVRRASAVQFTLGDLALEIAPPHESHDQEFRPLDELAKALGILPTSLTGYRRVAAAWPRDKRESRTSWSVHAILAGHPDRFDVIKHPPPGPKTVWSCEAARNAMKQGSA
ncbi:DUF6192 family protein [Streptomyces sp. NPDC005538]|uniref:DUF6192 family protein n=1 Tax=unclassified Streptomyces TaxID=2593676 RepID=UPI0033AA3494